MTRKFKLLFVVTVSALTIVGMIAFLGGLFFYTSRESDRPIQNSTKPSPTVSRKNPLSRIDDIINNMDWGNIAFNVPEKMKLETSSSIQLVLSPTSSIDELKEVIVAEGEKEGARVHISDLMEARLSGSGFQISPVTPETQAVSWNEITEWKWDVVPNRPGRHKLYLTLTALINVEGNTMPRRIRTFDKTIEVEVSSWQVAFKFFQDNWEWLWTLIIFPIGYWIWRRHNEQTRKSAESSTTQESKNIEVVNETKEQSELNPKTQQQGESAENTAPNKSLDVSAKQRLS